jgi:hypothetical protein
MGLGVVSLASGYPAQRDVIEVIYTCRHDVFDARKARSYRQPRSRSPRAYV